MLPLLMTDKGSSGRILTGKRERGRVVEKIRRNGIQIHVFDSLPYFTDSRGVRKSGKKERIIEVNGEILAALEAVSAEAKNLLLEIALGYEESLLAHGEEEKALRCLARLFARMDGKRKELLIESLGAAGLDPGCAFRELLEGYPGASKNEQKRLAARMKARALSDLPYDRRQAVDAMNRFEGDLPAIRLETLRVLASTYDRDIDSANARRIFRHCVENGRRLLVCRFGRAFFTDALLIANSKELDPRDIRRELSGLRKKFRALPGDDAPADIGPELQKVINLGARDAVSLAAFQGALQRLRESLLRHETACIRRCDARHDLAALKEIRGRIDELRAMIHDLERGVAGSAVRQPVFVCFVSRIHELDAVNVVRVNELLDPFYGENPEMEALLASAGQNCTISPNPAAWLRYASDWVEALPAYAHYVITPHDGGYQVSAHTEREVLEIVYKSSADEWAENILDVMARENVSIARRWLARRLEWPAKNEEGVIRAVRRHGKEQDVGRIACQIEKLADRNHRQLTALQVGGRPRCEALEELIERKRWEPKKTKTSSRRRFYAALSLERRRALPNANVLTTLGPTETETNIANWLEEAMSLYLIEKRHNLGEAVRTMMDSYRKTVGSAALEVIRREEMEGELLRILGERGAEDTSGERREAALAICSLYPEITLSTDAAVAGLLPGYGSSPHGLWDYVGPLAKFTARRAVVRERGFDHLLDDGRYRFASSGPFKRFNLAYTPSRVDLGPDIIESVRSIPKWVGGSDRQSALASESLYALFNLAGVTAVDRSRVAEFLKVGENFFTRGGVFYLSLTAGANVTTLGIGDFEFLSREWNRRGDRRVLPSGETYGGFCVPKEFSLLFAVVTRALNPKTVDEICGAFGISLDESTRERLRRDLLSALKTRVECEDPLEWEEKVRALLAEKYGRYTPRLPQLALTLQAAGAIDVEPEKRRDFMVANWKNRKALGLEEINRSGVFDKVRLLHVLVKRCGETNPETTIDRLIGVTAAGYKEDVTDVRFSAGARKLEIFAGLEAHLLEDLDPEGRSLYASIFDGYDSPLDLRLVGQCTAKDMFGHIPMDFSALADRARSKLLAAGYDGPWVDRNVDSHGVDFREWEWEKAEDRNALVDGSFPFLVYGSNLSQISAGIKERCRRRGLSEAVLQANARSFGADLNRWKGIEKKDLKRLAAEIGPLKHIFVAEARGIYPKERYEAAVRGADFIDLGIPDKELLDLIDDLPRLVHLMKDGREKPLFFIDGTSGARRFAFSFRHPSARDKVKELIALHGNSFYGCMGIARETVDEWKEEMHRERAAARLLLSYIMERNISEAEQLLRSLAVDLDRGGAANRLLEEEMEARRLGVWRPYHRFASERMSRIVRGIPLKRLDFGSFLLIGGRWLFNGLVSGSRIEEIREDYEFVLSQKGRPAGTEEIIRHCFRPIYVPREEPYREVSTGVSGSLKAVESVALKMESREIRRWQMEEARRLAERRAAFREEAGGAAADPDQLLEAFGKSEISEAAFGRFLAQVKRVWGQMIEEISESEAFTRSCLREIDGTFRGGSFLDAEHRSLAQKGENLFESAGSSNRDRIAAALELLDIALLVENTLYAREGTELWRALARFFDMTLNNHVFDCVPYHYHAERTSAFNDWPRTELLRFSLRHHARLHRIILGMVEAELSAASGSPGFQERLLGRYGKTDLSVRVPGIAVNAYSDVERRWFSYTRLRDLATLIHDGYSLPEVREGAALPEGINVAIVYPIGNTTVSVALEQAPRLRESGVNLFSTPFPSLVDRDGRKRLVAEEIFTMDGKGQCVLSRLAAPVPIHAVWFHFTHCLRARIEETGLPVIQPLLWEAATYLKCDLPEMIKGCGFSCPDQRNWYGGDAERLGAGGARARIEAMIREMASRHRVLIVKAEKESGGRRSKILPVASDAGFLDGNIAELSQLVHDISRTDNVVVQEVIPSRTRQLFSEGFLDLVTKRFITELGIGIDADTPLFSYFRLVVMKDPERRYTITHRITVVSTAGVANVGQGGRLFEYRDEKINPKYRTDLRKELEAAALSSLKSQEEFIRKNRREILSSYMASHRSLLIGPEILEPHTNTLGRPDHEILYEMGDYMCVLLVDGTDALEKIYDHDGERFITVGDRKNPELEIADSSGVEPPYPVKLFDRGKKKRLYWSYRGGERRPVSSTAVVKIEPNPGAGLWRPHNDRLKLVGRDGEGVYQIFRILGEWGKRYSEKTTLS